MAGANLHPELQRPGQKVRDATFTLSSLAGTHRETVLKYHRTVVFRPHTSFPGTREELPSSQIMDSVVSMLGAVLQVPSPAAQLTKVLAGLRHTFVVADATLPDCPLVFASDG